MTHTEYETFRASFDEFMMVEGLANLSTISKEPYFSWRPCDCCKRTLGGNRYDANGYNPVTKEVQDGYRICEDCMYYAEYGKLDDMSMLGIKKSRSLE